MNGDTSAIPKICHTQLVAANVNYGSFGKLVKGPPPGKVIEAPLSPLVVGFLCSFPSGVGPAGSNKSLQQAINDVKLDKGMVEGKNSGESMD